jgi:signal transduction histidine kinase
VAHDLHNPVTIVAGYGEELLNALGSHHPLRDDVAQILAAADRIARLAGRLVEFAQRHANPPGVINVPRAIAALEQRIAQAIGTRVRLELHAAGSVMAFADETQFEEVILALVSNAGEEARQQSSVVIGCEVETITEQVPGATLAPGQYVTVSIHDDGRVLNREQRKSVFELFLPAQDLERTAGATLARAYATVREWDGDIAFSSEPFLGSTFRVYLPYCPPAEL